MTLFMSFNKEKQETQKNLAGECYYHVISYLNMSNPFSSDLTEIDLDLGGTQSEKEGLGEFACRILV
jgi:hypothetical protein